MQEEIKFEIVLSIGNKVIILKTQNNYFNH